MPFTQSKPAVKPFTWSYSRLKNFETCPKRHYHLDIVKDIREEEGEALLWGNAVHKALANRLANGKVPLPVAMAKYEHWCKALDITVATEQLLVEQKYALTKDLGPTEFFSKQAWYRGIGDVVKINDDVALIIDWKTGKIIEDDVQLALMAACVFAHYPEITNVCAQFVWLKDDATTRKDFTRDDMVNVWNHVFARLKFLETAHETQIYPAKPNGLCRRWCPVTICPEHGE